MVDRAPVVLGVARTEVGSQHMQAVDGLGRVFYWPPLPYLDKVKIGKRERVIIYA